MNLGPPPAHAHEQETPVMKKLRLFALESVTDELQHPPHNEKHKRINPQPVNEDAPERQNKRNENCWNPQGMAQAVYRVLMAVSILCNPLLVRARFVSAAAQHGDLIIHGIEE